MPFFCYWPSYENLDAKQRHWYFYWRSQVRRGIYPATDLSYIFLHTYELINLVGARDPQDGLQQLQNLWLAYREPFSKLDGYLVDWQADFSAVYGCDHPQEVYRRASAFGAYVEHDLAKTLLADQGLSALPLPLLEKLMDYRPTQSKFWRDGHAAELEDGLRRVLVEVDESYVRKDPQGRNLLQLTGGAHMVQLRRRPFLSAPYEGSIQEVLIGDVVRYSFNNQLRSQLTAVAKHAENCLREQRDFRGRLRGYELGEDLSKLIEKVLRRSPERRSITIDPDRLKRLSSDSDSVRARLLQSPSLASQDPSEAKPLYTDIEEMRRLVASLGESHRALLLEMSGAQWTVKGIGDGKCKVEALAGDINRAARRELGNDLLLVTGNVWKAEEDYQDELDLVHKEGLLTAATLDSSGSEELDQPWAELAQRLASFHLLALGTISANGDLTELARTNNIMPACWWMN